MSKSTLTARPVAVDVHVNNEAAFPDDHVMVCLDVRPQRRLRRSLLMGAAALSGTLVAAPPAHAYERDAIRPIVSGGGGALIQTDYVSGSVHVTGGVTYFREVVQDKAVGYFLNAEVGYAFLSPAEDKAGHFGELRLGAGFGHEWIYGLFEERLLLGSYDGFAAGLETMVSAHGVFDIVRLSVGYVVLGSAARDETRHGGLISFEVNVMGILNVFLLGMAR
ncbi:MAG: hypothetical protein U0271_27685 [Polyangiaceae bacterium]